MDMVYDLIIIGGGPAGYNAAERAAHEGMKILLAEKTSLGGVCLNEGCIPTKTFLYSAKIFDYAKHSKEYGVSFENPAINQSFVVERKNKVVKNLISGVSSKLMSAGVNVVKASAFIEGKTSDGFKVKADNNIYTSKKLLICTGSTSALPPVPGLKEGIDSGFCVTNKEILDMKKIPEKLVIIGGGVIGLEMASYFNSVGTKVVVIEMLDHIAGMTDPEITHLLQKNYTQKGIEFKLNSKVTSVEKNSVIFECDGKSAEIKTDNVLVAVGRRPTIQNIGIENINILTEKGYIVTDEYGRTNAADVYAAGDVNGKSMLAHTAYREGEVCINNMVGKKDRVNYNTIPSVIYTNPEVAGIGETTETVKQKNMRAEVHTFSLRYSGRYIAENENGNGIIKIIVDTKTKTLLGMHIIGNYASEIIYGAGIMMETKLRLDDIKKIVFPHPTVCEVIREGIYMI